MVQVVPAISLVGSTPTFYRVPITIELLNSISVGKYPKTRTTVRRHIPVGNLGMIFLNDRGLALRCYKAFYKYVEEMDAKLAAR